MKRLGTRRKREEHFFEARSDGSGWILTFLDMLMVLLSFFILQFSMNTVTRQTFARKIAALSSVLPSLVAGKAERTPLPGQTGLDAPTAGLLTAVSDALTESLGNPNLESQAGTYQFRGGITVGLEAPAILIVLGSSSFAADSADITFMAKEALQTLGLTIKRKALSKSLRIEIAAHTDTIPSNSADFPTNWELSTARAMATARQIIDAGVEAQAISVIGYAGSKAVAESDSRVGRYRNRRIELKILPLPALAAEPGTVAFQ